MDIITSADMRALEQEAIASGRVTGLELMERAGQGVVAALLEEWPGFAGGTHRAVVLCGPGNNGGDGFVVARLLRQRGWDVEVFASLTKTADAQANRLLWEERAPVRPLQYQEVKSARDPSLWVDAIFGIGLNRRPEGEIERLLCYLAGSEGDLPLIRPKMLSIDVPSGLNADNGEIPGKGAEEWAPPCPFAHLTVTFHRAKHGHLSAEGPFHCGKLIIQDIGL